MDMAHICPKGSSPERCPSAGGPGRVAVTAYHTLVLQGLHTLRQEGLLCDFTLVADGCHFHVHKALLASVSEYFRAVFRSGMIETRRDAMELKGVSAVGLRRILSFVYTGELIMNEEVVVDVLRAANHLQLQHAIDMCTQYLMQNLHLENIKDLQSIADTYDLIALKDAIQEFLLRKISKFSRTNYFKQLPLNEVSKLIKDDRLHVSCEIKVVKIIFDWINYHREKREPLIGNLMKDTRLGLMSKAELQTLLQVPYIRRNRHCVELIRAALHFSSLSDRKVLIVSPPSEIRSELHVVAFSCTEQRSLHTSILYNNHWCLLDMALPQPRHFINAAATVCNNFLYVCGGQGIRAAISSCLCYNPYDCKWTTISPMTQPRKNFELVSYGLNLYAICGISNNFEVIDDVEVYSIEHDKWVSAFRTKSKITDMAACVHKDRIYIAGGVDENCFHVRDFAFYDTRSRKLQSGPDILEIKFKPRMMSTMDKLYLTDLYRTEGIPTHLEEYDPTVRQWSKIPLPGVQFSRCFSAINIGPWIYFIGRNDVEDGSSKRYNVQSQTMEDIRPFPWEVESPLCVSMKLPNRLTRGALNKTMTGFE